MATCLAKTCRVYCAYKIISVYFCAFVVYIIAWNFNSNNGFSIFYSFVYTLCCVVIFFLMWWIFGKNSRKRNNLCSQRRWIITPGLYLLQKWTGYWNMYSPTLYIFPLKKLTFCTQVCEIIFDTNTFLGFVIIEFPYSQCIYLYKYCGQETQFQYKHSFSENKKQWIFHS
jgi:hypothetical protein